MVDNFDNIKRFVDTLNDDEYMNIMVCARHKDNPDNVDRCINNYYITSWDQLMKLKDEIINMCNMFEARAYININNKRISDLQNSMLCIIANNIKNENNMKPWQVVNKANGDVKPVNKRWLVDLDKEYLDDEDNIINLIYNLLVDKEAQRYRKEFPKFTNEFSYNCGKAVIDQNYKDYIYEITSVTGKHIIVRPFNLEKFKKHYPNIDIHKNDGGVLLYKY